MNQISGDCRNSLTIVLPSLNPDAKFSGVVSGLVESGFRSIVIVDDGSDADHQQWFALAEEYSQCIVLHHGVNKGKGRALKTAFSYVLENIRDAEGVITIDGDGQHLLKDVIACGNRMLDEKDRVILGCRDFDLPGVPPRSVAGNKFTSRAFRLLFGICLSDTQTGLRAIPAQFLQDFCAIEGERFEYETNMLLQMKRNGIAFSEQPIETVYDPEDYPHRIRGKIYCQFRGLFCVRQVDLSLTDCLLRVGEGVCLPPGCHLFFVSAQLPPEQILGFRQERAICERPFSLLLRLYSANTDCYGIHISRDCSDASCYAWDGDICQHNCGYYSFYCNLFNS